MYYSNAEWSKFKNTQVKHSDIDFAKTVCNMLVSEYTKHLPCSIRGICIRAWVTDENDNVLYEA